MRNITELRDSLCQNYEDLQAKKLSLKDAKELANTAGKIINSLKMELMYNMYMGNKSEIPFLNGENHIGLGKGKITAEMLQRSTPKPLS